MKLELFYRPTCPFCQKVLQYINERTLEGIELKDKSADPAVEQELLQIGGKAQVPCLVIDGKALYESDDIIEWLDEHQS